MGGAVGRANGHGASFGFPNLVFLLWDFLIGHGHDAIVARTKQ